PLDPLAAVILVVALPLLVWFSILAGKGAEEASGRQWASLARLGGHLLDQIRGLGELKLAGTSQAAVASVARAAEAYGRETMAVLRLAFLSALVVEFVATGAIAGVAVAVGFRLLWGELDFATGFFVLLLAPEFFAPLREIGLRRHARLEAMTALGTLAPLLAEPKTAGHQPWTATTAPAIRFEAVRVVHDDGRVALDGFDLDIAAGEHVALVGSSGAGKSTLFALLARFIEPSSGRILINGQPLADIDVRHWRHALVSMPQAPQFFDGSIADNIVMGRTAPGPACDDAVRRALGAAGADAIIARLPQGLATPLAERGKNLSGGEAQRLALARAFFAAGPLVLFDEPTSHLDAEAQAAVLRGLATLRQGRTVLTIAHRLETVASADRIVLIEDGRVLAQGAPQPMLDQLKARAAPPSAEHPMRDLLRLLKLWRPAWPWLLGAVLVSLLTTLANLTLMATAGWFVTAMAVAGATGSAINYFTPSSIIPLHRDRAHRRPLARPARSAMKRPSGAGRHPHRSVSPPGGDRAGRAR
ncbi:MAG: thiol reductant ABC exporter subunit CydD, partial [Rhodopseudomonas palustris]|nr:thiol reductant ABC exporter subunit CydD [Rhodopseudomonas palustris]